jgi:endonuclease YncB( thermonuclease family)
MWRNALRLLAPYISILHELLLMKVTYIGLALRLSAIAICGFHFSVAQAETLVGTVVGIADGDTLTIVNNDRQEVKIKLAEIDAPEKYQAFGARSRQSLSDLCLGKQAEIIAQVKDRYERTLARVKCAGVDANTEQVRRGMAWVYPRQVKDHNLYIMQHEAKVKKRGLWVDSSPTAPWEFRKRAKQHVREI